MVNFGEVRRAQLVKSTLLTSTMVPRDLFRSFKVCLDAKERERVRKETRNYPTYSSLVQLQAWFLSCGGRLPLNRTAARCLGLQRKICPCAEHYDDDDDMYYGGDER